MKLIIDVNKMLVDDPLNLYQQDDSIYKMCSRYIGHLREVAKETLEQRGLSHRSFTGSMTGTEDYFRTGDRIAKVYTFLTDIRKEKNHCGIVTIDASNSDITDILERTKIPKYATTIQRTEDLH